jgi:hypothetical protein
MIAQEGEQQPANILNECANLAELGFDNSLPFNSFTDDEYCSVLAKTDSVTGSEG